jgi:hypothetical protein
MENTEHALTHEPQKDVSQQPVREHIVGGGVRRGGGGAGGGTNVTDIIEKSQSNIDKNPSD